MCIRDNLRGFERGAQDFVNDHDDRAHGDDIMHTDKMGTIQNGCGDGGCGSEFGFFGCLAGNEVLARGAREDRQIERGKLSDVSEDFGVLLFALAKA